MGGFTLTLALMYLTSQIIDWAQRPPDWLPESMQSQLQLLVETAPLNPNIIYTVADDRLAQSLDTSGHQWVTAGVNVPDSEPLVLEQSETRLTIKHPLWDMTDHRPEREGGLTLTRFERAREIVKPVLVSPQPPVSDQPQVAQRRPPIEIESVPEVSAEPETVGDTTEPLVAIEPAPELIDEPFAVVEVIPPERTEESPVVATPYVIDTEPEPIAEPTVVEDPKSTGWWRIRRRSSDNEAVDQAASVALDPIDPPEAPAIPPIMAHDCRWMDAWSIRSSVDAWLTCMNLQHAWALQPPLPNQPKDFLMRSRIELPADMTVERLAQMLREQYGLELRAVQP